MSRKVKIDELDGYLFKSHFEVDFYKKVKKLAKRKKFKLSYEGKRIKFVVQRHYVPDFIIEMADGRVIYIETKGYLRPTDRTKLIAVKEQNPEIDLRLIFLQNNKLNKNSKTYYSDWAIKNGFEYAIGRIPLEWLE